MGMPAARLSDLCTGHGCFPPRKNIQGSDNVFVNGRPHHRKGDGWAVHCCKKKCHPSNTSSGSSTVFINGIPAARVQDSVGCGSKIMTGSANVFEG